MNLTSFWVKKIRSGSVSTGSNTVGVGVYFNKLLVHIRYLFVEVGRAGQKISHFVGGQSARSSAE